MAVSFKKARDFVYNTGTIEERAIFGWLFENRSLGQAHRALLAHKNADNGWGNKLEHDLTCPDSHPAALEYLLVTMRGLRMPPGNLLDGTVEWLETQVKEDGSLSNPASLREYPIAPWWNEWGGQTKPASIVGNLTHMGLCTPALAASTRRWVQANLTVEAIKSNEWIFMAYLAYDYFLQVDDFPDVETYRQATIENIIDCARKMPEKQYYVLFNFAMWPDSPVAQAMPRDLIDRSLNAILETQQDDGGWKDEHGLAQWYPVVTTQNLLALRNYGALTI